MKTVRFLGASGLLVVVFAFLSALMFRQYNTSYWLLLAEWALVLLIWVLARWVEPWPLAYKREGA